MSLPQPLPVGAQQRHPHPSCPCALPRAVEAPPAGESAAGEPSAVPIVPVPAAEGVRRSSGKRVAFKADDELVECRLFLKVGLEVESVTLGSGSCLGPAMLEVHFVRGCRMQIIYVWVIKVQLQPGGKVHEGARAEGCTERLERL